MKLLFKMNYTNVELLNAQKYYNNIKRLNSTKANTTKLNTLTIRDMSLPNLNINRNQKRLVNSSKAIISFIQVMTNLNEQSKITLIKLMNNLENMFLANPAEFVKLSKILANWFKVNLALKKEFRTQGDVPKALWIIDQNAPTILYPVMELFDGLNVVMKPQFITVVLSILELYNVTLVPKNMSMSTITEPMKEGANWDVINIPVAVKNLGINQEEFSRVLKMKQIEAEFHYSSSSGPNGHALWSAHLDAQAIVKDQEFFKTFEEFCSLTERPELSSRLVEAAKSPTFFKLGMNELVHSKLHFILEKGDKVRTVAILDWWSQEVLCPLHDTVADVLRPLEQDGTFDQDKIAAKVRSFTANPQLEVFSLDLTAATDRLPVKLQSKILDFLTGVEGYGDLWAKVMTERDFRLPTDQNIRYSVGQPMGAKSSFPMLGLTHHLIVMEAASRALKPNFRDYVVLGDDIVIADRAVAEKYRALLDELGMAIAMNKTIWINSGQGTSSVAEICKRFFFNGIESSALPVKLIANCIEFNHMIFQLQEEMHKRDQITMKDNFKYFAASLVHTSQGLEMIAGLNLLSPLLTGMKSNLTILNATDLKGDLWRRLFSVPLTDLIEVFKYTVCQEQLKRLGIMVKDTSSTFDVMAKAGKLMNATGIGYSLEKQGESNHLEYKPFINFTPDDLTDWSLTGETHPAHEVIKADIRRVNNLLMELSVATSAELIRKLMNQVVDSLKLAALDMNIERSLSDANTGRKLLETTARNIELLSYRENKTLSFSVKLNPFNIIWNLKFTSGGQLSIYRSASKVTTTLKDAIAKFESLKAK
ncbi:putative RNA dependent RNA polymerase [Rhizoctonia solani mitovirus 23]|uniref:RNA dependent RNA polymerase n=1 Tax=Rhizoctonia solani mitovirus 23 TaxID=2598975 RepID=A0ABX5Y623_9VIRU|nr:putative RNA dependent RNA polymerase [Rhizoctonia solani mitovirus 23]QDW65458.1 putative RNA dependent RNA polymerase [Rhizoctonia solani mitovirus 23]